MASPLATDSLLLRTLAHGGALQARRTYPNDHKHYVRTFEDPSLKTVPASTVRRCMVEKWIEAAPADAGWDVINYSLTDEGVRMVGMLELAKAPTPARR